MIRVLLCAALGAAGVYPAAAQVLFFLDRAAFNGFSRNSGKQLKGVETFEEALIGPGQKLTLPDPLLPGVPNVSGGSGFPAGLAEDNLAIQANTSPLPAPLTLNPSGSPIALYVVGAGFNGANSTKVGEDLGILAGQVASYDLLFLGDNKTGIGFELSRFAGFNPQVGFNIAVYNIAGAIIGSMQFGPPPRPEPTKMFFGVWSDQPIGRINIFDDDISIPGQPVFSPSAVDNIEMWVPEPASLLLLAAAAPLLRRR